MRLFPTFALVALAAVTLGLGCKSAYQSDLVAICACPYDIPAGASSADVTAASIGLGKCMKQAATTQKAKVFMGAFSGESVAPVRGKLLRDALKEEGMSTACPLADACDKGWATQHPSK